MIDKQKSVKQLAMNGKAAFYASIYEDLKNAAAQCGWALGLHGSLANDMDIMAMPWTEDAKPVEEVMMALSDCFVENPFKEVHTIPHYDKPNGRVVYTMPIFEDFYLDINVIQPPASPWIPCSERLPKFLQPCFITVQYGGLVTTFRAVYWESHWSTENENFHLENVIAWMPAEPYKEGE